MLPLVYYYMHLKMVRKVFHQFSSAGPWYPKTVILKGVAGGSLGRNCLYFINYHHKRIYNGENPLWTMIKYTGEDQRGSLDCKGRTVTWDAESKNSKSNLWYNYAYTLRFSHFRSHSFKYQSLVISYHTVIIHLCLVITDTILLIYLNLVKSNSILVMYQFSHLRFHSVYVS